MRNISDYVDRKHRGGRSNLVGNQYENHYAVLWVAKLLKKAMLTDSITAQAEAFVDDLMIIESTRQRHFQLKNSPHISWSHGLRSIADDFEKQKQINDAMGVNKTLLNLICSCEQTAAKLKQQIPPSITGYSNVEFFPYAETFNQLILICPQFQKALSDVCINSDLDKLEVLAVSIVGIWSDSVGQCTIEKLTDRLSKQSTYFAVTSQQTLDSAFIKILGAIPNFKYSIDGGYFSWSYNNYIETGVLSFPTSSKEFLTMQSAIIQQTPLTFDDLEAFLT